MIRLDSMLSPALCRGCATSGPGLDDGCEEQDKEEWTGKNKKGLV